jgi:hypothetical protein
MTGTHVELKQRQEVPERPPPGRVHRIGRRLLEEGRSLVPAWLFFFSLFFLLRLMRTQIPKEQQGGTLPPSRVLLGSLLVAKGILLVDLIPFVKRLARFPVFGSASLKTLAYYLICFLFQYLDELLGLRHQGMAAATREFGRNLLRFGFWVDQVWLVVLLFGYSATRELFHHLGPTRFREVFFGRSRAP